MNIFTFLSSSFYTDAFYYTLRIFLIDFICFQIFHPGRIAMFLNKVEICGVNTSELPLLSNEEKENLFLRIERGDKAAREKYVKEPSPRFKCHSTFF